MYSADSSGLYATGKSRRMSPELLHLSLDSPEAHKAADCRIAMRTAFPCVLCDCPREQMGDLGKGEEPMQLFYVTQHAGKANELRLIRYFYSPNCNAKCARIL